MKNTKKVSIVIVARNEELKIAECIESVKGLESEILVFDNNSIDNTVKIAKSFGAKIFEVKTGDFSERKNFAFAKASFDWILLLDADERLTSKLIKEIKSVIVDSSPNDKNGAYAIPRKNIILGKEFKYGNQWPDYVVRLFKKTKFVNWEGELHEQPVIEGNLGYLKNPLIHHKHDNLSEMVEKTNEWSGVEAKLMYDAKHPPMNLIRFFTAMLREFNLRMIKQKSFLDGSEGVIYALYQVFSRYLSYAKLWEMQLKK